MKPSITWVLALTVLVAGCGAAGNGGDAANGAAAAPVRAVRVEKADVVDTVRTVGVLAPRDEVRLAFKIGGVVDKVGVEAGDRVQKGQRLASLKRTEVSAAVEQASASLEKARRDLDRAKELRVDEVATEEEVEDLTTAWRVARANLDAARFNERFAHIEAPADGVVLQRLAEENELVQGGEPVLVIGATGEGWVVRVALADRDAVRVETGAAARLTFDAFPGRPFEGRVSRIDSAADPQTGTFEAEIDVAQEGMRFARGLVAKVELTLSDIGRAASSTVVPVTALVEADGPAATVYVVDEHASVARRRAIEVGPIAGESVVVHRGLAPGERVITDGAAWLREGTPVRLVDEHG
jgi:membrane fusion protein, multidrug efflux system